MVTEHPVRIDVEMVVYQVWRRTRVNIRMPSIIGLTPISNIKYPAEPAYLSRLPSYVQICYKGGNPIVCVSMLIAQPFYTSARLEGDAFEVHQC